MDLDKKYHFLLRKLHSLTGIVPIGVFLIEHLLTNSMAFQGPEEFNRDVRFLHGLPYLFFLELFGIFLPIAFHAAYGVKIALTAEPNASVYPYLANWRYTLQRVTGYVALVFIVIHLFKFRFAHVIGWGPPFIHEGNDYFEITRKGLMEWRPFGLVVPAGWTLAFYVLGLSASVFHFCNGIWSFCVSWGITIGERAQRRVGLAATALGLFLMVWGMLSLTAFATAKPGVSRAVAHGVAPGQAPSSTGTGP
ncbi:MAG: succinate dehydrogenase cytochrome b558 subunit [Phycisphaerae bacterium]|nr:succinate dehydrogenase cytochrome b558 subunit [Phycisphaerae bacterium]